MSSQRRGRAQAAEQHGGADRPPGLLATANHKSRKIVHRKAVDLLSHGRNLELFPETIPQELDDQLDESVKAIGITNPLLIAGAGCHSPRGTLYAGHRRRKSALRTSLDQRQLLLPVDDNYFCRSGRRADGL